MRKAILLFTVFIFALCLQAQSSSSSSGKNSDLTTLQGCLSTYLDHYLLTEITGTTHQLEGAAGKLGHQVGHQIEVTGKPGIKSIDTTIAGAGSGVVEQPVFQVKTVKRVADACEITR